MLLIMLIKCLNCNQKYLTYKLSKKFLFFENIKKKITIIFWILLGNSLAQIIDNIVFGDFIQINPYNLFLDPITNLFVRNQYFNKIDFFVSIKMFFVSIIMFYFSIFGYYKAYHAHRFNYPKLTTSLSCLKCGDLIIMDVQRKRIALHKIIRILMVGLITTIFLFIFIF